MLPRNYGTYLIKGRHGLISTPNLDLIKCRFRTRTLLSRTLRLLLIGVLKLIRAPKDIQLLLVRVLLPLVKPARQDVLIWTCLTLETVDDLGFGRVFEGGGRG